MSRDGERKPFSPDKPLRVGVLNNPGSNRNLREFGKIKRVLARYPETIQVEAQSPEEIAAALGELAEQEPDIVAINGGDGTVATTLTTLFNRKPFSTVPLFAALGGGTTNMTARDVGFKGGHVAALERLLGWAKAPAGEHTLIQRPALSIRPSTHIEPMYGMFFGAGAIIKGIEYCHDQIHSRGIRNDLGPAVCTLRVVLAMLTRNPTYTTPAPITVELEPPPAPHDSDYFVLYACTLESMFFGIRPYWGKKNGAFYFSSIRSHPDHMLRALPALLRGRANGYGTEENGYFSHKVDRVRITLDSGFTLDGEVYHCEEGKWSIEVGHSDPVTFIRV